MGDQAAPPGQKWLLRRIENLHPLKMVQRKCLMAPIPQKSPTWGKAPQGYLSTPMWSDLPGGGVGDINWEASALPLTPHSSILLTFYQEIFEGTVRPCGVMMWLSHTTNNSVVSITTFLRSDSPGNSDRPFQWSFVVCRLSDFGWSFFFVWHWKIISNVEGMVQTTCPVLVQGSPLTANLHDTKYYQHAVLMPIN